MKPLAVKPSSPGKEAVWGAPGAHSQSHPVVTGYQRQLLYKHDDGSYSAFGKGDEQGNTW